ncbi:MAG: long-chain fatty acid--CoA ligase, partial [Chloroflexi bacterium]|nr:long-chain fatty acid--CoA ligase [Chloroflexota bacterium]
MSSQNIWSAFEENVKKAPHKAAAIYLGTRYSYLLLKRNADAFAAALSSMGVKKGDRVVIYAPNSPQWMIAFLGIQRIGAVAVPITPIYTPPDVSFICNNCEAKLILCADSNLGYVIQVLPQTKLEHVIVTGVAELLPTWKRFI